MNKLSLAALLALIAFCTHSAAQEVKQSPLRPGHPLIGVWRIDFPNQNCFEEYDLRADGTKLSQSGQERNESVFEISEEPSARGFYRWVDKITKGNGKPDCGGSVTALGHVAVNFVRLHPSGKKLLLCEAEAMSSCFAEFYRRGGDV
jgi:hypothetical protein